MTPDSSPRAIATGDEGGGRRSWILGGFAPTSVSVTTAGGSDLVSIEMALRAIGRFDCATKSKALCRSGGFVFVRPVVGRCIVEVPAPPPPPEEPYPSVGRSEDRCPLLFLLPAI